MEKRRKYGEECKLFFLDVHVVHTVRSFFKLVRENLESHIKSSTIHINFDAISNLSRLRANADILIFIVGVENLMSFGPRPVY